MTNDTTRAMPTVEEIEAMAKKLFSPAYWLSGSDAGHEGENDYPFAASEMLYAIADQMRESEPAAWQFQHSETGLMCELSNDGINTPESFLKNNPRHIYIRPLYTNPLADAEDARRYRYIKSQMETGAVQTMLPLHRSVYWIGTYIDCDNVQNVDEAIDNAMKEDSHDH